VPEIRLNEDLPIASRRGDIEAAIRNHQVVIVCGETGSGKSTQLPLICLGMGRGVDGVIGHTQPRRIAARSVATRVAEELGSSVGQAVGFRIRFTDATSPTTLIKLMTDGILLAESQRDRFFQQYDTLIIDEAHERSLNIDFLLGRLRQLLSSRPDLKLIITSATIDAARFAEHFGVEGQPAPVLEVAGRTYPVEIRYRPPQDEGDGNAPGQAAKDQGAAGRGPRRRGEADIQTAILDAVDELGRIDQGDILIFQPTERDIHETAKALRGRLLGEARRGRTTEILPLYSRLSTKDQQRIFEAHPHRRIVIATNVAESSLTVPGIRYVIDTGTARISRYSARSRMQRLPVEAISQASANQRAGRCGRVAPGVCIRLYSAEDFAGREQYTVPEIQRTNLASVILQTEALQLGPLETFPFLEPPRAGTITDGYRTLFELGALDENNKLTETGRQLASLPVDPRVGRIVLAAHGENCLAEMLIIAAVLELQEPRERPVDQQQAADEAHAKFQDTNSDFLSYLKLWDFYHHVRGTVSRGQLRKVCQQNFLSYNRMREWVDIHQQLAELVAEAGIRPCKRREDPDAIHRALLTGFLANIALLTDRNEYTAAGGQKVSVWPGSGLFTQKPKWIVAAELIETTRRYVRTVARIKPEWIEPIAGPLLKRTFSDPEWDGQAASAMAHEKVTLFGLPIVPRRRVRYATINPEHSREMMLRHGLVEGDIALELPFLKHNQRLIEELEGLQTRTRRHDLIVDDDVRLEFYEQRIPLDVCDGHRLQRWLRGAEKSGQRPLHMTKDNLRRSGTEDVTAGDFPDVLRVGQIELPLEYHLEPGSPEDGISLIVPREALNQLDQKRLGWLVPGLLEEKVIALIRSLPRVIRRQFVPAGEVAREVLAKLKFGEGDFEDAIARQLTALGADRVTAGDFDLNRMPVHLRMNVRVRDAEGDTVAAGRSLGELQQELGASASSGFAAMDDKRWQRDGITAWDFGDLPAQVRVVRAGVALTGYPSLVDCGETVSLRLADLPSRAAVETREGIRRLAALVLARGVKTHIDHLPRLNEWTMLAAAMGGGSAFRKNLGDLMVDRAMFPEKGAYPRSLSEFEQRMKQARQLLPVAAQDVVTLMGPLMESYGRVRRAIADAKAPPLWKYAVDDVRQQVADLTVPGFLTAAPWGWLKQYPRYLEAVCRRLKKLMQSGVPRDRKAHETVAACVERWRARKAAHEARGFFDPQLDHYRWMIEELRVSLFAQELGTAVPVSEVRLEKQWEQVRD